MVLLKLENECEEQYLMKDKINFDELYKRYLNCTSFKYEYVLEHCCVSIHTKNKTDNNQ